MSIWTYLFFCSPFFCSSLFAQKAISNTSSQASYTKKSSKIDPQDVSDLRGKTPFQVLDNPEMIPTSDCTYLSDDEPILGLLVPEGKLAFPLRMVSWHHIINMVVSKRPVVITYCKACNAWIAFDAIVHKKTLTFSLFGYYKRSFVMYDRETESLWYQLDGAAIGDRWRSALLTMLPLIVTTWKQWKAQYPTSQVLASTHEVFATYMPMESSQSPSKTSKWSWLTTGITLLLALGVGGIVAKIKSAWKDRA
jgi:hypothetical protein